MAQGRGSAFCLGVVKGSAWGTAVTVDAANLAIRPISWDITRSIDSLPFEGFNCDSVEKETSDVGRVAYQGTFSFDMKNTGMGTLLAMTWGAAGVPVTVSAHYKHTFTRAIDHSVFGTLAWWDGYKTYEIDSAVFHDFKLTAAANGAVMGEVSWTGRALVENSATNPTGLTSLTENALISRWLYDDSADYQGGVQGAGGTEFEVMAWDYAMTREVDIDNAYSNINGKFMRQPQLGASQESGSLTLPHSQSTFLDTVLTKATQDLFFLHETTTLQDSGGLYLPSVTFDDGAHNPEGKASIMQTLDFTCRKADSTPSGFSGPTSYLEIHNAVSTDALA